MDTCIIQRRKTQKIDIKTQQIIKTLLYNPIFINPQAYIVFPNLCGGLKQEIDSVIEPAIFDGKIEVKTIANGDIKLVRYYSNTNKIDLSEFKDSWIE